MSLNGSVGDSRTPTRSAPQSPMTASVDLDEKARAVCRAAAVTVGAPVGAVAQKLIDQISVGAVQFDAVEARLEGVARAAPVILDDAGDLRRLERARRDEGLHAVGVIASPAGAIADGATGSAPSGCNDGCEMRPTCQSCRKSARRPRARPRSRASSRRPARRVDARRARIADTLRGHLRRFGDDQARAGALRVIGGVERLRHVARPARLRVIGAITMRLGNCGGPI